MTGAGAPWDTRDHTEQIIEKSKSRKVYLEVEEQKTHNAVIMIQVLYYS